jgi:RHS repeat-associated protein
MQVVGTRTCEAVCVQGVAVQRSPRRWPGRRRPQDLLVVWCLVPLLLWIALLWIGTASAQESARSWRYAGAQYDTQAAAESAMRADYSSHRYLRDIEIRDSETLYHYWRGAAMPSETVWTYRNQGSTVESLTEQEAYDRLKIFYQTLSDQRGCSHVAVVPDGEWTRASGWTNGPSHQENRVYSATFTGCSYSPSGTTMFRTRDLSCPGGLSWNGTEGVCGGGSTQTIASRPVACAMGCTKVGNPVDIANGEKYQPEPADFALGWVSWSRTYHSGTATGRDGLGRGWTHDHAMRLALGSNGAIGLVREDGAEVPLKAFSGYREAVDGSGDRLTGSGPWILHTADRVVEFDVRGRMTAQRFEDGTALTYEHDALNRLVAIVHSSGRRLEIAYLSSEASIEPRIASIALDGTPLASYGYRADGMLETATFADQTQRRYHYEDARFPWHLTGVSIAGARHSTYDYDARGRMISSRYAGEVGGRSFTYPASGGAIVTDARGLQTTYGITPDAIDEPYRQLSSSSYDGKSASRTYAPLASDFRRRLQTTTDRNGVVTRHLYAEATDAVSGEPALIHTILEAEGRPEQREREIRRSLADNRLLMTRDGPLETRIARNARLQPTAITLRDTVGGEVRTATLTYCEQADVNTGLCPQVGLLRSIDGPRTDVADVATFTYRPADHPDCVSTPATCAWRKGDLWKTTNALGHTVEVLARDGAGRVLSIRDANGVTIDTEYDPRGRPTATKVRGTDNGSESDDRVARIEYWPDGAVKQLTQPDGTFVLFGYDAARRLTTIADNAGNAIVYTLNAAGDRTREEVFDTGGALRRTLARSYDTLGRLRTIRNAQAQAPGAPATMTYHYDDAGRLERSVDALARETHYGFDALDRVMTAVQNATAATTANDRATIGTLYDSLDRPTRVTDPNGLQTHYSYNAFGDLLQQISPDTGTTTAQHDVAGNLRQSTDATGRQRILAYDALNRVTAVSYLQDTALNESYLYDTAQPDCAAGETFLVGRLAKMTDASGSTTYCYNRHGDLVRKVQRTQGRTFVLHWQYAANGRLQAMTYPDGSVVDYQYDAQGRMVDLGVTVPGPQPHLPEGSSPRQKVAYDVLYHPWGGPARWRSMSDRMVVRTRNQSGQPGVVQAQTLAGTPIDGISLGYEFDAVGNFVRLRDGDQADPPVRAYRYDGLDRLIEAKDASEVVWQSYAYDKTGNRQSRGWREWVFAQDCTGVAPGEPCTPLPPTTQWKTEQYAYQVGTHRLSTRTGLDRSYDMTGNLILETPVVVEIIDPPPGGGGETESAAYEGTMQAPEVQSGGDGPAPPGASTRGYQYNAANRMSATSVAGEFLMGYRYNGRGERVYRQGIDRVVHSVFDASGRWIGDYDANGAVIQQAIWLDDLPVGLLARDGVVTRLFHVEPDALGTPRTVIDPTRGSRGTVVWRWELSGEAFGDDKPNEDPDGDGAWFVFDQRFPGQQYDSASGFNYNYFRDYETGTGRYAQSDPIGLAGGVSTYGYVGGNPLAKYDFFGLAELILLAQDAPGREFAVNVYVPGYYTVVAHGSGRGSIVRDSDSKPLTPRQLAKRIQAQPNYESGTPVALLACRTGSSGYAQELASELGADVISPDRLVYGYSDGNFVIAEPNEPSNGYPSPTRRGRMFIFLPIKPPVLPPVINDLSNP